MVTIDDIKEMYKDTTFYLYHIKGKKWGCSMDVERRLKEQGFSKDDTEEIKEVIGIEVADKLEKELNLSHGYPFNHTQSYLRVIYRNLNKDKSVFQTQEFKQKISDSAKKMWESDEFRKKHSESLNKVMQTSEYKEKISNASKKKWESDEYRKKWRKSMRKAMQTPEYKIKRAELSCGCNNPMSSLKEDDVLFIRKHYFKMNHRATKIPKGMYSTLQLAQMFNCSKVAISNIVNGKSYKNVK